MASEQPQWHLNHLLKWLHKFNLQDAPPESTSLCDGVVVSNVLNLIEPSWFNDTWMSKIKQNVGSNKIMKVSNLKKVLERVVDYYEVHLDQRLSGFTIPDVNKIGESEDEVELCRLLQLVLGCAVHCERQAEFIEAIQQMEEDVQRGIMAAIQELPGIDELAGGSLVPNADSLALMTGRSPSQAAGTGFQHLIAQLEACNEEKKQLTKERHQLNLQISTLQDEIQHLQAEVESLRSGGAPLESMDGANPSAMMQKREIQRLTEELLRSDAAREELRLRCENLEQEMEKMRARLDDLLSAAEQTRSLKDEVDILREKSARLENAQSTIDSMRRKVEEGNELKRQLRKLEEKYSQCIQQNMELEEEVKKLGPWKSQLELQKKQIAEFQRMLDDERRRADKFELQYKNLIERNETLTQEKERLVAERDKLIEQNEEIRFAQLSHGTSAATMMLDGSPSTTGVDTLDMIPPEIKEKLLRLEHENRMLKEKKDSGRGQDEVEVLKTVNAGLVERIERLETENRCPCRASQSRNSVSECQVRASSSSTAASMVASIKAKLESKPVFAGAILPRPAAAGSLMQASTSCSQLSGRLSFAGDAPPAGSQESKYGVRERVERLKEAFLAGSGASSLSGGAQSSRSSSYGYDKALGFGTPSAARPLVLDSPIARKWADSPQRRSASVSSANSTDSGSGLTGSRSSLLRAGALQSPPRRESDASLCSRMDASAVPPPPPVEAVVITRDSSPRDETDSGYRGCDSLNYDESASPSRYSPEEDHFDEALLVELSRGPKKATSRHLRTPPDDSIEIDASFHDGRDSVDSASVSSFSIMSETMASSERLFDRSQSLILTPRSARDSDTASTKSFGKSLKKRKMLKAAANAMFSLCGP